MDTTVLIEVVLGAAIVGAAITLGVQQFLKWKASQGEIPQALVEALVEIAEKMYEGKGRGKEKLAWVLGVLHAEAAKLNVEFDVDKTTEIIDAYVEKVFNTPGIGEDEVSE